jgi:hypothetical protein
VAVWGALTDSLNNGDVLKYLYPNVLAHHGLSLDVISKVFLHALVLVESERKRDCLTETLPVSRVGVTFKKLNYIHIIIIILNMLSFHYLVVKST